MRESSRKLRLFYEALLKKIHLKAANPEFFIREVLGYLIEDFHKKWFDFQRLNRRTLILAPRGHGKTTICNICYVLWFLLKNPDGRVLLVSNTQSQAEGFLMEIRAHIRSSPLLGYAFGLKGGRWRRDMLVLPNRRRIAKEASITATGVLGPIISRHFDLIILDDVVDEENASSGILREKLRIWYFKVLLPTLEPEGELHILGTRYHPDDLYQTIIDAADEVFYL